MALYNNGFPMGYQPMYMPNTYQQMYTQPMMQQTIPQLQNQQLSQQQIQAAQVQAQQVPQQQVPNSIIWVKNEREAFEFPVAPNGAVSLWDENRPVIYLKQSDASGRPTTKIYDLVERIEGQVSNNSTNPVQSVDYAPKSDLIALQAQVEALKAEFEGLANRQDSFRRKREERENGKSTV